MPTYLLEIGTEELPADYVSEAQSRLKSLMAEALNQSSIDFDEVLSMGTPRRLSCLVKGLAPVQKTINKKVKGPPVKSSFDAQGKPLPAANGFAQKQGVTVDALLKEEISGIEYLVADITISGKPSASVLSEIVPQTILQLSGERLMRWGSSELKFSRPIRWIMSVLDKDELPIDLCGIKSGRETFGNRVLSPGKISIASPEEYVAKLREVKVLVDPVERKAYIKEQVTTAAAKLSGSPRQLSGSLIEEVLNILEWPHAVVGEFAKEYLELPDTLIETIMVHHQRYFPVESKETANGKEQKLLPYFIAVANNDSKAAEPYIKQGNERVIKARLADGKFFFFDDQKTKLKERRLALEQLTFQEGLGSYQKKTERIVKAGRYLSESLKLDAKYSICLERTLELCKLDLVSNLVRELPELQGYVGSWYAAREGEPPEVAKAIVTHYAPRSTDDDIAPDLIGRFCGLVDKMDSLVGLFALGRRPSGSSDPYALRRQAQGIIDTVMDGLGDYSVNLFELANVLMQEMEPLLKTKRGFDSKKALFDLNDFLMQRVKFKLQNKEIRREIIESVCNSPDLLKDLSKVFIRSQCVEKLLSSESSLALVRAGVRIGNILKSNDLAEVNPNIFENEFETRLWERFSKEVASKWEAKAGFKEPATSAEYEAMMQLLMPILPDIDAFFEKVMVNDPDETKRKNRQAVLSRINRYFVTLADFTKLQSVLP